VKAAQKAGKQQLQIVHAYCWAHVRRKFNDSSETGHKPAKAGLGLIADIYAAEMACQEDVQGIDDFDDREERLLVERAKRLAPAIDAFFAWVHSTESATQPQSFQKALGYATNQEQGLRVILAHACCDLDNNIVEREIRAVAIGRKNWEFAGSEDGAKRLACLLSILGTCKLLGIDPHTYMADVLMEAKRRKANGNPDVSDLTPSRWLERIPK